MAFESYGPFQNELDSETKVMGITQIIFLHFKFDGHFGRMKKSTTKSHYNGLSKNLKSKFILKMSIFILCSKLGPKTNQNGQFEETFQQQSATLINEDIQI